MQTARGGRNGGSDERWERMWSHREHLLKVARRRSMSVEDAEDAVHEAMLRAVENPHVDDERLAAWLTTVTMRLCVDRYRQVNREAEVRSRSTLAAPGPVPVEEAVCDRAEARWLAVRSGELPARQAEALRLKSEDLDVGQVARVMGLSYQAVESLLARARRTLRNSLAGTLGFALWLFGRARPRTGGSAHAAVMMSTAATVAVLGLAIPFSADSDGPQPAESATSQTIGPPARDRGKPAPPSQTGQPAPGGSHPPGRPAEPTEGARSLLPEISLPAIPPLPELSAVPTPSVSSVSPVPSVPSVPLQDHVADVPDVSVPPDVPVSPDDVPTALPTGLPSGAAPTAGLPLQQP